MDREIGWEFAKSTDGSFDGLNDSGIEIYAGNPFMHLAREVIQNSLDAKRGDGAVTVCFEKSDIPVAELPGQDELLAAFRRCKKQAREMKNEDACRFFKRGIGLLGSGKISCLKILDYNTTGLRGDENEIGKEWFAITKARGISAKESRTAGGSFGIGKHAPFAISDLRTVFYYTHYTKGGQSCERAQGKAILMSHSDGESGYTRGNGFYGLRADCRPLNAQAIPRLLAREIKKDSDEGTTLFVPGLRESENWREHIIAAVVANFFYAIDRKTLEVGIDSGDDLALVNDETLPELLARPYLQKFEGVKEANFYYRALKEGERRDKTLSTIKHSILWTKVDESENGEGFPQSVAIVRNTGMLITDNMKNLRRWVGYKDFAAVCVCDSNEGNELLRGMENPQHNAFEPWRLDDKAKGERAIMEMGRWIRNVIKGFANVASDKPDTIDELADLIPDLDPDDRLPGDGDERDFEGAGVWSPKPIRARPLPPESIDGDEDGGGEGSQRGRGEGGGGSGGDRGGRARKNALKIEAVRILPLPKNGASKRVRFTPKESGVAHLHLSVAGDSFVEHIGIKSATKGETSGGGVKVQVEADKRFMLDVTLSEPINAALSLTLSKDVPSKDGKK